MRVTRPTLDACNVFIEHLVYDPLDCGPLLVEHQVLDDIDGADMTAPWYHQSIGLRAVWGLMRRALAGQLDRTLPRHFTVTLGDGLARDTAS